MTEQMITLQTINKLSTIYNLGEITSISRVSGGDWVLNTPRGLFALRLLKFPSAVKRMFYDQAFTDFLAQNGYPARRFIRTKEGNLICKQNNNAYYMIEYFEGIVQPSSQVRLSTNQLQEAGKYLAKLHRLSTEYQGPKVHKSPFQSKKTYIVLDKIRQHLQLKRQRSNFDELAFEVVTKKIRYVTTHPFERESFMLLPKITNHGDFHAGNIVFDSDDRIIAILDFEYCTDMPRIWDIAWALTWLSRTRWTEAFSGIADLKSAQDFLSSYNAYFPLSHEEQVGLGEMCISASFHTTYFLERYYLKNKIPYQLEKCSNIEEWFWWSNNQGKIIETILQSCQPA